MIFAILRSIGAILVGLAVAMVLVVAVEGFSAVVHPFPPGVDSTDLEVCRAHVANYPTWVLVVVVFAWGGTVLLSVWLATRLGTHRHLAHGVVVGAVLLAGVAFNMMMLPYPDWFEFITLVVFLIAIFWGIRWGRGPRVRDVKSAD